MSETVVQVEPKAKRARMSKLTFITEWNSEKSLADVAKQYNCKEQSLEVRAVTLRKEIEQEKTRLKNLLEDERVKSNPNKDNIARFENHLGQLNSLVLRSRKAIRKAGLDGLLELAEQVRNGK